MVDGPIVPYLLRCALSSCARLPVLGDRYAGLTILITRNIV